jgi:hypothetical protein
MTHPGDLHVKTPETTRTLAFLQAPIAVIVVAVFSATAVKSPAVTLDYGGNSSVAVSLNSASADNSAALSSPGTSISLPNLDIGPGQDGGLYVALFSQGTTLSNPWCKWNVRGVTLFKTVAVPGTNDTMYLFSMTHGDTAAQIGKQNLVCGWDNATLAAVGAVSFKGVQTWPAQYSPAVTVNTGSGTHPLIDISSGPNHMTLAFMMHATSLAAYVTGQTRTLQWAISGNTPNAALTTAPGASGSVRHQFILGASLPWVVVGIDLPNQPVNIDQRWLGLPASAGNQPPSGVQSLTLQNFQVGSGVNEYMVVGITSPGSLTNLQVTWDSQAMSQIDAYPIPNDTVAMCKHGTFQSNGASACDTYGTSTQPYLYWYGLKLPHEGNRLLNVSWTNDLSGSLEPLIDAMALSFANVDQSTPYQNTSHANGSLNGHAGPVSLRIKSGGPNDMTVALLGDGGGNIWCDPTQASNVPSVGHGIGIASSRAPGPSGGGVVTHSWMHGTGPANNESSCASVTSTTYSVIYGMSGFDIVASGSSPRPRAINTLGWCIIAFSLLLVGVPCARYIRRRKSSSHG